MSNQSCRAGAAWSRHFQGGAGAGADFFVGQRQEPEVPAASFWQAKKKALCCDKT